VFEKVPPPWVVKPADRGSSVGLALARTFRELAGALETAFSVSDNVLVEEFIRGREATCGVVDDFRDQETYALPPIEIRKPGMEIWSYKDKYSGETEEICPGNFSVEEKRSLETLARQAHRALGLRHYSRSDFILAPRGIYLLEVNTLPGMTAESLLPKALAAVGCNYPDFLDHVIKLALAKR
jgi:D-alanine-D-alanine ligase